MIELREVRIKVQPDPEPDLSWMTDDERAAVERGDRLSLGVYAEAEIVVAGVIQRVRSGGLWGIDVLSMDDPYLSDIGAQELEGLVDVLKGLGASAEVLADVAGTDPKPCEYV